MILLFFLGACSRFRKKNLQILRVCAEFENSLSVKGKLQVISILAGNISVTLKVKGQTFGELVLGLER